jgi:GGDEF domain-containing protein
VILNIANPVNSGAGMVGRGVTTEGIRSSYDKFIQAQLLGQQQNQVSSAAMDQAWGQIEQVFNEAGSRAFRLLNGTNTGIEDGAQQVNRLAANIADLVIDINNFKPYNDTYGFSRGDEVLRMVGRIMSNTVKEAKEGGFVGHIGGDDFVFIVPRENVEQVCTTIIANFNIICPTCSATRTRRGDITLQRTGWGWCRRCRCSASRSPSFPRTTP